MNLKKETVKPRAKYIDFSPRDCETWFECPVCGTQFGCYSNYINEHNERCCPNCKTALDGLD